MNIYTPVRSLSDIPTDRELSQWADDARALDRLKAAQNELKRRALAAGDRGAGIAAAAAAAGLALPTGPDARRMNAEEKAAAIEAILAL